MAWIIQKKVELKLIIRLFDECCVRDKHRIQFDHREGISQT